MNNLFIFYFYVYMYENTIKKNFFIIVNILNLTLVCLLNFFCFDLCINLDIEFKIIHILGVFLINCRFQNN